ncbi:MAG: hypothetical protein ACOY3Y_06250 [Acidobacteriota bacterium]
MTHATFQRLSELLIGDWVGQRRSAVLEQEVVRSQWRLVLDGGFLREHWHTAGSGGTPELTAEAFFRVSDAGPGDFIAVYRSGKIAFGESSFEDSVWTLTHRWLREPGIATIHLRFLDEDTYEQEVAEVAPDGTLTPESLAVMRRERSTP